MNRRSLVLILLALFAMALVMGLVADTAVSGEGTALASTFNFEPRGLRAVYETLRDSGYRIRRWQRPYAELPEDAAVLIIAAPLQTISAQEWRDDLLPWLRTGRTLVLASSLGRPLPFLPSGEDVLRDLLDYDQDEEFRPKREGEPDARKDEDELTLPERLRMTARPPVPVWPVWDVPMTRPPRELMVEEFVPVYANWPQATAIYAGEAGPYVWHVPANKGHILLTATPEWLTNAFVAKGENLEFLLDVLARFGANGAVLFDERAQGYGTGDLQLADLWRQPAWAVALLHGAILGVWYAAASGRRFGAPLPLLRDAPRRTLEYIDAMANLYRRAELRRDSLAAQWHAFRLQLARRYGLSPDAPVESVRERLVDSAGADGPDIDAALADVRRALSARPLRDRQLLSAARALDTLRRLVR